MHVRSGGSAKPDRLAPEAADRRLSGRAQAGDAVRRRCVHAAEASDVVERHQGEVMHVGETGRRCSRSATRGDAAAGEVCRRLRVEHTRVRVERAAVDARAEEGRWSSLNVL